MPQPFDVENSAGTVVWSVLSDGTTRQAGGVQLQKNATPPATPQGYLQFYSPDGEAIYTKDASGNTAVVSSGAGTGGLTWLNVKAFGAVGDGVTDDTKAVQAAMNAATGPVYFPPGNYLCSTLNPPTGTVLIGTAQSAYTQATPASLLSAITLKSGTNGHLLHGADQVSNVQIQRLKLDGNKAGNSSGDVIHLDDASAQDTNWSIVDCYLTNSPHDGLYIGPGRQTVTVFRTWIMAATNNGATVNGADATLHKTLIGTAGANGVYLGGAIVRLTDCDVFSNTSNGVLVPSGAVATLTGCGIDRNQLTGVTVQGADLSMQGCILHSNSQQTNNNQAHILVSSGNVAVTGCMFTYDGLANNANFCIQNTGGTVREWNNRQQTSSAVQGYMSQPKRGTATLVAGAATVTTSAVQATSRIFLTSQGDGGTPGWVRADSRVAGTSFHIQSSSGTDTSSVAWMIDDPA